MKEKSKFATNKKLNQLGKLFPHLVHFIHNKISNYHFIISINKQKRMSSAAAKKAPAAPAAAAAAPASAGDKKAVVVSKGATKKGICVRDVDGSRFVKTYAAYLKSSGKIQLPKWADIVKTSHSKQLPPLDDDWFYIRLGLLTFFFIIAVIAFPNINNY